MATEAQEEISPIPLFGGPIRLRCPILRFAYENIVTDRRCFIVRLLPARRLMDSQPNQLPFQRRHPGNRDRTLFCRQGVLRWTYALVGSSQMLPAAKREVA